MRTQLCLSQQTNSIGRATSSIDALRSTVATPFFDSDSAESTASHTVQVTFESGPADIQITYLRSGDEWLVTQFSILADALSS